MTMILYRLIGLFFMFIFSVMTVDFFDDPSISHEIISIDVGKRIKMECELNSSMMNENRKGLWVRLGDAEVFFYSKTRINRDQRFQIDQRSQLQITNGSSTDEIIIYSLIINGVRPSDDGFYSCQADNQIIKIFQLNIVEPPYFNSDGLNTIYQIKMGQNLTIGCKAQGRPNPSIIWMKKIDENVRRWIMNCSSDSSECPLTIFNIQPWHHGIYECIAKNIKGTINRFYEIDVQFSPKIFLPKTEMIYSIDDQVILNCYIDANPEPTIDWFHRSFNNDDYEQNRNLSDEFSLNSSNILNKTIEKNWFIKSEQINSTRWKTILFIQKISFDLLNSKFICHAKNFHGENENSIKIYQSYSIEKQNRSLLNLLSTNNSRTFQNFSNNQKLFNETKLDEENSNQISNRMKQCQCCSISILLFIQLFSFLFLSIEFK